jgi:hypothetical protein
LLNDKQFDSSREKGRPFVFVIGKKNVIKGTVLQPLCGPPSVHLTHNLPQAGTREC